MSTVRSASLVSHAAPLGRRLLLASLLAGLPAFAWAAEAARIFHIEGDVKVAGRAAKSGDAVNEGDEIITGANGYVYMKTVDDGTFILRPKSNARIVTYHVDVQNPKNTRVKFELNAGIAQSRSGAAVKAARQNFRFNTPVAAIGVRGTDFTVYTDAETSQVSVLSGGVIVSGFGGSCSPEGVGPCEGSASRELMAGAAGQMLQVRRGQMAPQLMEGTPAPPRADATAPKSEPAPADGKAVAAAEPAKGAASASVDTSKGTTTTIAVAVPVAAVTIGGVLDAQKNVTLLQKLPGVSIPKDPVVTPPPVVVDAGPPEPPGRQVFWGRYQPLMDLPANIDKQKVAADNSQILYQAGNYLLARTTGADWVTPDQGSVGFKLQASEAVVRNELTSEVKAAQIANARLNVDFGKATFATDFDLMSESKRYALRSEGAVTKDGQLIGGYQFLAPNNMSVQGAMTGDKNGANAAYYLFRASLGEGMVATGGTSWTK